MANKWFTATAMAVGMVAIPTAASADSQLRVFGGLTLTQDIEADYGYYTAEFEVDSGFVVGAAYGVDVGSWLIEGEIAHREADISEFQIPSYYYVTDFDGSISATSALVNAWYNFDTGSSWGFYAGGGIGVANAETDGGDSSTELAWQLGAGATYRPESGFGYGFGYRYFNVSEYSDAEIDVTSHDFIFEVTRRF